LSTLKNVKPKVQHSYNLSDELPINNLKKAIESIDIPNEINIKRESVFTFKDKTKRFLIYFFVISVLVNTFCIGGFLYFQGMPKYQEYLEGYQSGLEKNAKEYFKGQKNMTKHLIKEMPVASSNWIKNNIKRKFWE
jgi:hypothetical protein